MKTLHTLARAIVGLYPKLDQELEGSPLRAAMARVANIANLALSLPVWHLKRGGAWEALPLLLDDPDQPQKTETVWLALKTGEVVVGHCMISLVGGVLRWRSDQGYEVHDVIGWTEYEVPKHPRYRNRIDPEDEPWDRVPE